jgi:hypothetical protein
VENPLYAANGSAPRDSTLVFLAGIVGVPWQDIATPDSLNDPNKLTYLTYNDMVNSNPNRWDLIVGRSDTSPPTQPIDPLMVESIDDRTVKLGSAPHPIIGAAGALVPSSSTNPNANQINGHETNIAGRDDLQYACIFPLPTPRDCTDPNDAGCDCKMSNQNYNRPLCDPGTTRQSRAKAYPGSRELAVLRDFGEKSHNSIVASICPKSLADKNSPAYGYNPAVSAIVDRLKEALRGKCLPRKLDTKADGTVQCSVVEAIKPAAGQGCDCTDPGREVASDEIKPAVFSQLKASQYCDVEGTGPCTDYCLCTITQFGSRPDDPADANNLRQCQTQTSTPTDIYGYCYVDPSALDPVNTPNYDSLEQAEQSIVNCPKSQQRLLRFAGSEVPKRGAVAMIACLGSTLNYSPQASAGQ